MRGRVEQLLGEDCRQIWLSTFHSLCARLLRREAPAIGLSRDFVIYDSSDQLSVVKQAMKALDIDDKLIQPRAALSRISQAKNRMESPDDMRSAGWSLRDQQISRIYEALPARARPTPARSISTTCCSRPSSCSRPASACATSTRASSATSSSTSTRTRTGRSTCSIRRLAEVHRNLCVVGDPDQSIYKWRGADLRNILDFEHDFPDAQHRQARAELPIDAGHSRRRVGGHQPQPQSQGQDALDRPAGRRAHPATSAPATRSKRPTSSRATIRETQRADSRRDGRPCSTAPTRSRARLKTR